VAGLVILGLIGIETARFITRSLPSGLAPLSSAVIGFAASGSLLYVLYRLLGAPTLGLARRVGDQVDYRYQRARAGSELKRRLRAIAEEDRVRALTASARVHENAARAVSEGELHVELEELKGRSEQVVMRSQSTGAARMLARYQAAFWSLKQARHMTPGEKARLLQEMRGVLAESTLTSMPRSDPEDEESGFSASAQTPVVLEYRAPGGQAIPVTADGFRRLLEREQLHRDDECRRMGSMVWTPVGELLGESRGEDLGESMGDGSEG